MIDPKSELFEQLSNEAWAAFLERLDKTTEEVMYATDPDFPWIPPYTPRIRSRVPEDGIQAVANDPAVLEPLRRLGISDIPTMLSEMMEKYVNDPDMRYFAYRHRERAELAAIFQLPPAEGGES